MERENKLTFRKAQEDDLAEILKMIANDQLGRARETFQLPIPDHYTKAFQIISEDPNQEVMVAEMNNEIVGTFQLSYLQYLTYSGGMRILVEAVRVKDSSPGTLMPIPDTLVWRPENEWQC